MRALVYGCMGLLNSSSVDASSTILPRYNTAILSHIAGSREVVSDEYVC